MAGLGNNKLKIRVRISRKDKDNYCVEFRRTEGDKFAFTEAYKYLTNTVLKFAVDDVFVF